MLRRDPWSGVAYGHQNFTTHGLRRQRQLAVARCVAQRVRGEVLEGLLKAIGIAGDPLGRGTEPEVVVRLAIEPGLAPERLRDIVGELSAAWAADATVAERIDSLSVQPIAAPR